MYIVPPRVSDTLGEGRTVDAVELLHDLPLLVLRQPRHASPRKLATLDQLERMRNIRPMLRFARQHFESLRPYRWRLERMREACKPPFSFEYKRLAAALDALDRAASDHLTPEEFANFTAPWIPPDHS